MNIGDILWEIRGKEKNGIYKFYPHPMSVERFDERKVFFDDGCGGSLNNIGKNWFYSRQEAIDHFLEKHESLEMKLPELDKEMEKKVFHMEKTDFQDLEVCKWNTVDTTTVYAGNVDNLLNITELLKWHEEECEPLCCTLETLTLSEIYEQAKELVDTRIFTVFIDEPLKGTIYQCGNYEDGKWIKYGSTRGYA